LLIDEEQTVDPDSGRIRGLAEAINAALPPTIRIFSCTKVNKRFSARMNCVLREYEYFMPLSFLKKSVLSATETADDSWDEDLAVETFCQALRRYEGIHDFHNFTKSRSFFYRQHARVKGKNAARRRDNDVEDENEDVEDHIEDEETDEPDAVNREFPGLAPEYAEQFADAEATTRKPLPRHRRAIYSCSGSLIHDFFGEKYLRVHIVGQAFLLHQIRCMIGGALAVATKGMTQSQFEAAIGTSRPDALSMTTID
jgi:tRNA pseudouridine38-40 synthase